MHINLGWEEASYRPEITFFTYKLTSSCMHKVGNYLFIYFINYLI